MKRKRAQLGLFLIFLVAIVTSKPILTTTDANEVPSKQPTAQPVSPSSSQPLDAHLTSVKIAGLRLEASHSSDDIVLGFNKRHETVIEGASNVKIVLFGQNFNKLGAVTFTADGTCKDMPYFFEADYSSLTTTRLVFEMAFPKTTSAATFRLCVAEKFFDVPRFVLIDDPFTKITTEIPPADNSYDRYIALPLLILLLAFSGLFSGLNLGLMTLSVQDLQLYIACGTPEEKSRAERILPLRKKGNQLLCTILLGNVLVNVKISTYLSYLIGGSTWAVILATFCIVLFGEIIPQAICVKYGLSIGAKTSKLTLLLFWMMSPVTFVLAFVLDYFFKEDITAPLERRKLMEMLRMSEKSGIDGQDEFKMVLGALELYDKTVEHAMTKFEDIFMLPHTFRLGPEYVNKILEMGYTRIPIYEHDRQNIVGLLFVKDLALLDPKDEISVTAITNLYKHQVRRVLNDMPLRTMLEEFKKGEYHLALVEKLVEIEDKDPVYEICGLITLEDIIEEIIQCEIIDETDVVTDNVNKKKRAHRMNHNMSQIVSSKTNCDINIQLLVVTIQFMSVHHRIFAPPFIVPTVLERLIVQKCKKVEKTQFSCLKAEGILQSKPAMLYRKGEFSTSYILILSGRAVITIGKENMKLEAGAWHNLGSEVLTSVTEAIERSRARSDCSTVSLNAEVANKQIGFVPDFDVEIMFDCTFVEISAADILLAYNMSQLHLTTEQPGRCNSTTSVFEIVNTEQSATDETLNARLRTQSENEKVQLLPSREICKFTNGNVGN